MASINATTSSGIVATADNTGQLQLQSAGTTVATFNTYGMGLGTATPSSGIGITFPATQVPSANANTLDDYEEGTWTPVLTCTTPGTFSYTVSDADGTYTKIGNVVTFSFLLGWSAISLGTGTGDLSISGLPFTSTNSACVFPVQTFFVNWVASTTSIVGQSNASNFFIRCIVNDGNWSTIAITSQTASQQNYIRMSGSYYTT